MTYDILIGVAWVIASLGGAYLILLIGAACYTYWSHRQ